MALLTDPIAQSTISQYAETNDALQATTTDQQLTDNGKTSLIESMCEASRQLCFALIPIHSADPAQARQAITELEKTVELLTALWPKDELPQHAALLVSNITARAERIKNRLPS